MFCHNCGSPLPDDARFCANCGVAQLIEEPAAPVAPPVPEPAPEEHAPASQAADIRFPDFEPAAPAAEAPAEKSAPEPVTVPVQLPAGTFTWEHVTISGEFTDGKGTITIHFE